MPAINPLLLLLEDFARQNAELEGQVHDLVLALGLDKTANVQAAFNIAETLAQVLILLSDGKPRSKEQLHGALYFRRPDVDAPEIKILDTLACKLRKCVRPYGIEIETIWSGGYRISAGLHVVQAAMEHSDPYGGLEGARRRRQERERERQRLIRAAQGRLDRQTYLRTSLSQQKPWQAEGISRRTWERRARKLKSPDAYEAQLASRRAWSKANREIERARQAKDRAKHGTKRNESKRRYSKQRCSSDPCYKLQSILRKRLFAALKGNFKKGSAVKLLGCTIPQFKERLEGMWLDGMTWENYGQWHIDHIEALATFDLLDPEQLAMACHYSNLQPLWALDNLRKGKRRAAGMLAANDDAPATRRSVDSQVAA